MGDTTHIEFSGLNQWNYDVQRRVEKGQTIVELSVPAISDDANQILSAFRSADVKNISVNRKGPDNKTIVTLTLNSRYMDAFDYLTDQPSRLVIDFFKQKNSPNSDTQASTTEESATAKDTKQNEELKKNKVAQRTPATTDILKINNAQSSGISVGQASVAPVEKRYGIFDGADPEFDRFNVQDFEVKEESIISSRENVYLAFPTLRMPVIDLDRMNAQRPIYEIIPKDSDENKQARLLLTLYNNKRHNVFLKTVEWFKEKYPDSEYNELIQFMLADTHFYVWLDKRNPSDFDLAMLRYRQALEKFPQTPLIERTLLLMGYATLDRGDYLGTLRMFEGHLRNRPQSPNRDRARFGVAESYMKLSKFDEALKQYRDIEKEAASEKAKVEAGYFAGDTYFSGKNYSAAISEYQTAIAKYPGSAGEYPNAYFNQAAAQFFQKDYRKSLEVYREFLKKFPTHEYAGYAMTRVGEILDILGVDKTRVVGAYLETYFRYGDSQSAIVARLRLLSSRMKGMKPQELEKAVSDIGDLAKKSELADIDQFATIMISDGYNRREDYDKATDLLVQFYQAHPTGADTKLLSQKIIKNINDKILSLVNSNKFIEALKTHNKYADNWLKSSQRLDTKFNVGRAFEQAGVYSSAQMIYKDMLNKMYAIKGTPTEKEKIIIEKLPPEDRMNLRLASVSFQEGKLSVAYDYLKNIKKPELLSEAEQIERVQLSSYLLDKRGDVVSATRYLVELLKTWTGQPELVADPYLNLAELEIRQNKNADAIQSLQKIDQLMVDSGKVNADTHCKALEKLGQLQIDQGQVDAGAETWKRLLELYETKKPLASIRYKMGQIFFKKGEIQKASGVWKDLKGNGSEFWVKLSQEQLKNSNWQDGYQKYIQRIPAMSEKGNP